MIAIKQVTLRVFPELVTADRCEVRSITVSPGTVASGDVVLGNEFEERFVPADGPVTISMTPEQYKKWGTDDDYAIDCLLENLKLVRV